MVRKIFLCGVGGPDDGAPFFVVLDAHGGHELADRGVYEYEICKAKREGRAGQGWCRCGRGRCASGCVLSDSACQGGRGGSTCCREVSTLCHQ